MKINQQKLIELNTYIKSVTFTLDNECNSKVKLNKDITIGALSNISTQDVNYFCNDIADLVIEMICEEYGECVLESELSVGEIASILS